MGRFRGQWGLPGTQRLSFPVEGAQEGKGGWRESRVLGWGHLQPGAMQAVREAWDHVLAPPPQVLGRMPGHSSRVQEGRVDVQR